jgi:hypothetical protein
MARRWVVQFLLGRKTENAVPAKLLAELNEKNGEKRFESKKRNRRAPDEEIKNHGINTGVAALATMEIKAEIGRRLVAQLTANVEKQNLVLSVYQGPRDDQRKEHHPHATVAGTCPGRVGVCRTDG